MPIGVIGDIANLPGSEMLVQLFIAMKRISTPRTAVQDLQSMKVLYMASAIS